MRAEAACVNAKSHDAAEYARIAADTDKLKQTSRDDQGSEGCNSDRGTEEGRDRVGGEGKGNGKEKG